MENQYRNHNRAQLHGKNAARSFESQTWVSPGMARPANERLGTVQPLVARPAGGNSPSARRPKPAKRSKTGLLIAALVGMFSCTLVAILVVAAQLYAPKQMPVVAQASRPESVPAVLTAPLPPGQTRILLLGSDQRPDDPGYRTDVMILLVLDTSKRTVSAVSFPRDLWVTVPNYYEMKINQVHALGGFDATADMFEANFGVRPDYYVLTNFNGFTRLIDNHGGIDVQIGQALVDDCDLPQAVNGDCAVEPGISHMDGQTALWYVRSRHTSSDFDRLRRAQEVLLAVVKGMVANGSLADVARMNAEVQENLETNMTLDKAVALLPMAPSVLQSQDRVRLFAISEEQATPSWSWDGMWILLPDTAAIQELLVQAGVQ